MTQPIIQSLWVGSDLSNLEKLCVQSFLDHGHAFHLYTYADVGGIPAGTKVCDANEILPAAEIYRNKAGKYEAFSDWFRYELLAKKGGWWVDMDCVCIKPFIFEEEFVFATHSSSIINTIMCVPAKHELCVALADACRNFTAVRPWDDAEDLKIKAKATERSQLPRTYLGPTMLDKAVRHFGLQQFAKSYMTFTPIDWEHLYYIFDDSYADGIDFPQATRCVHVWNTLVGQELDSKNARYSEKSLFEQLKAKHGITNAPDAPYFTPEDLRDNIDDEVTEAKRKIIQLRKSRGNWTLGLALVGFGFGMAVGWVL